MTDAIEQPVLSRRESVTVNASPRVVWDLVTSVERTGEWSPVCRECSWEDGWSGPEVGAWFRGRNEHRGRVWETRSQVVTADRERAFSWLVGGSYVQWGYELEPLEGGGTRLTETWEFRPVGRETFRERYGDDADREIAIRLADARSGIPATLAAVKAVVEG